MACSWLFCVGLERRKNTHPYLSSSTDCQWCCRCCPLSCVRPPCCCLSLFVVVCYLLSFVVVDVVVVVAASPSSSLPSVAAVGRGWVRACRFVLGVVPLPCFFLLFFVRFVFVVGLFVVWRHDARWVEWVDKKAPMVRCWEKSYGWPKSLLGDPKMITR